jgi:hypothetical protein
MKRSHLPVLVVSLSAVFAAIVTSLAQTSMSSWPSTAQVNMSSNSPGVYELSLPLPLLDKATESLSDLRLVDADNREIPFAVRIRREIDEQREIGATLFNAATVGSAAEVSVDVGEGGGEHNEVEIQTSGSNFRRRVNIEGSDTGREWRVLRNDAVIFGFTSNNSSVDSSRVSYPTSRYRYLRIRVLSDEMIDKSAPMITGAKVMMSILQKGELATWAVAVPSYDLFRNRGAHASSWTIDLGGRVPCSQLSLGIQDQSFSRPFQVEVIDDPDNVRVVANGGITRRVNEEAKPVVITFEQEEYARKLRLMITDYSNQTLTINSIEASAPARQMIFELKQPAVLPLRVFAGNANAPAPHYDYENEVAALLSKPPTEVNLGSVVSNPSFVPEPLPLTERVPWLIYLVLAASSLALGWILFNLARTAMKGMTKHEGEPNAEKASG